MEKNMSEWKEKEREVKKKLLYYVQGALQITYKMDYNLIERKVHERNIVFRFGIYLQNILYEDRELKGYNLDFEYNKNLKGVKRTIDFKNGTYPDILLHKRGCNKNNIMVIEFKTWWNRNNSNDLIKLQNFTSKHGGYNYKIGLSIIIEKEKPKIIIVENGKITGTK